MDNFSIVRPANVYGSRDRFGSDYAMVIPSLLNRIFTKEDPVIVWGDGSAIRDFIFSKDVAEGCLQAMYYGTGDSFVNLGSGIEVSIADLLDVLHGFLDFNHEFTGEFPGHPKRVMDISLARNSIHYDPSTLIEDGLKETWNWYLNHYKEAS